MRKKILGALLAISTAVSLTGCNKQLVDTTYKFDYAIIKLTNDEIVEGKVQSWTDFHDGDTVQVKIDGVSYLVHASNITLIYNY